MVGLAMLALRRVSNPGYTHLASLSIRSPKPGVSTIVREMRVPSSSSSVHLSTGVLASIGKGVAQARDAPTVRGLILTPSSTWAEFGSSLSL